MQVDCLLGRVELFQAQGPLRGPEGARGDFDFLIRPSLPAAALAALGECKHSLSLVGLTADLHP